ncbi:unnamed protein product [Calypogeia fissa]
MDGTRVEGDQEGEGAPRGALGGPSKSPELEPEAYMKDPNERANEGETMDTGHDEGGMDDLVDMALGRDGTRQDAANSPRCVMSRLLLSLST